MLPPQGVLRWKSYWPPWRLRLSGVTVGAVEDVMPASAVGDVTLASGVGDVVVVLDEVAGATEVVEASISVEGAVAEGSALTEELVLVDGSFAAEELVVPATGATVVGELVEEATVVEELVEEATAVEELVVAAGSVLPGELVVAVGSPPTAGDPSTVSVGVDGSEASGSW